MKGFWSTILLAALTGIPAWGGVTGLQGTYRNGQVFLTWHESGVDPDARLAVYSSFQPITPENLKNAELLADKLNAASARDWWLDRSEFVVEKKSREKQDAAFAAEEKLLKYDPAAGGERKTAKSAGEKVSGVPGFVIMPGGRPLDPRGGLHVHTVTRADAGPRYYAVVEMTKPEVVPGANSLLKPVTGKVEPVQAIPQAGLKLIRGMAKGRKLVIMLHGRGGGLGVDAEGRPACNALWFADRNCGWREGLPFKFKVKMDDKVVRLDLCDRVWAGRKVMESPDRRDHVRAINTFWFGYNVNLAETTDTRPELVVDNFTEKLVLAIIDWAGVYLGCDLNCCYVTGGSMGGTAAVGLVTRYPERFAAAFAQVPVYTFTWERCGKAEPSAKRLACSCGPMRKTKARMVSGADLLEFTDGVRNVGRPQVDVPPIFATNGRQDASIPWVNNPKFYASANAARQAFAVYWNNGAHNMTPSAPDDVKKGWYNEMLRYRRDRSFPAFSNSSDNRDYGKGDPAEGNLAGWVNRGMNWDAVVDEPGRYAITLCAKHPDMRYPVKCDVTIRRRQRFLVKPGDALNVKFGGESRKLTVPEDGLLTVENLVFPDGQPVRLEITKANR